MTSIKKIVLCLLYVAFYPNHFVLFYLKCYHVEENKIIVTNNIFFNTKRKFLYAFKQPEKEQADLIIMICMYLWSWLLLSSLKSSAKTNIQYLI